MSTLASVAARETAFVSGAGMLHGIAPGTLNGLAVGALATGACCLVVVALRLLHRTRLAARDGMWGTGARRSKVQRDYFATPAEADAAPAEADIAPAEADPAPAAPGPAALSPAVPAPAANGPAVTSPTRTGPTLIPELFAPEAEVLAFPAAAMPGLHEAPAGGNPHGPAASCDPLAAVPGIDVIVPGTRRDQAGRDRSGRSGHRSKHRMTSYAGRRPEARRPPRHAAPSAGLASRMSGRFAAFPLLARS
jgi:hypothetical protein